MSESRGRCHWVRGDDGLETLIPHCWGSINSPSYCTCDTKGSEIERALYGRMTAEQEVMRLRGKLERQAQRYEATVNTQKRCYAEIQRLRARVAELEGDRGQ